MILEGHDDIEVAGEAGDGPAAVDVVAATVPDVVLMDVQGTVKTHVGRILAKLQLRDRIQAVILGYECGLAGGSTQG